MGISVAELDAMPEERARELLADCCGASRWVSKMIARRPFGRRARVDEAADEVWRSLDVADWREAFEHHPRIGEKASRGPNSPATEWAAREQSGVERANAEVRDALAMVNTEYERRFGYIYIVCATGKTAEEMLALARERLANDPDVEIGVAAEEQRKITALRLKKLLREVA